MRVLGRICVLRDSQFSGKKRKLREYSEKVWNIKECFDHRVLWVQGKGESERKIKSEYSFLYEEK